MRDAVQTRRLRGSFPKLKHLLFSPVKDILLLPVWLDAVLNRRVQWRGHRFLVGRMTRLRRARVPRRVRRRVSRVARFATRIAEQRDRPAKRVERLRRSHPRDVSIARSDLDSRRRAVE